MAKGNSRDFFSSDFSLDHPVREGEDSFESFLRANRIIQEYVDYFIKANASYESFEIPVWKSCASGSGRKEITFSVMKKMTPADDLKALMKRHGITKEQLSQTISGE